MGSQRGENLWPWLYEVPSLLLSLLISIPFFYGLAALSKLRKGDHLARWRRNYATLKKIAPFVLPVGRESIRSSTLDLALVVACAVLTRVVNVLTPMVLRRIVDRLASISASDDGDGLPVADVFAYVLLQQVLREALTSLFWVRLARVEADVANRLACHLYDKLLSLSADFHEARQVGETYGAVTSGGARVARFAMSILFSKVLAVVDLTVALVAFWRIFGLQLAASMAAIGIVYVWASTRLMQDNTPFRTAHKMRRDRDEIGNDVVRNWHTVSAFNNIAFEQGRYRDATTRSGALDGELMQKRTLADTQRDLVMAAGLVVLALLAGAQIKGSGGGDGGGGGPETDRRSVGDFVMLLQYWADLAYPIQNFVSWVSWFDEFIVESDKMIEIIDARPTVRDRPGAPDFELRGGGIVFENVLFSYGGGGDAKPAVRDVSFAVPAGTTAAVVGETGGGKSTLLRLLCRSYDVSAGAVRVDGQDVRDVRLASLMRHVAVVPQAVGVFNGTVEDNVRYGRPSATRADVERACGAAALHDKIMSFRGGYGERIGDKGTKLSGGEAQRLAIARALLRDAKIVLFDEAMSSLDSETEWAIQARLREFCRDKTVIVIAHRLATVAHADLILAVKGGVIVESGTQEELLARKGYYYSLWDKQRLQ